MRAYTHPQKYQTSCTQFNIKYYISVCDIKLYVCFLFRLRENVEPYFFKDMPQFLDRTYRLKITTVCEMRKLSDYLGTLCTLFPRETICSSWSLEMGKMSCC